MAKSDATRRITIQGVPVTVTDVYAEGHPVTALEANALNQTRAEGIRNNLAKTFKDAIEAAGEAGLSEETLATLQAKVSEYEASYTFSSGGGRTTDPIQKEAKAIATVILDGKLAENGIKKSDYPKDKYDATLQQIMAMPEVQKKAAKTVEETNKLASNIEL